MNTVRIRGKTVRVPEHGTKADIARSLLAEGYTVSEISKAVPMAYSQVHSIAKAQTPVASKWPAPEPKPKPMTNARARAETAKATKVVAKYLRGEKVDLTPRIGKLRTPGLPNDRAVGECANCGYDLVVRPNAGGFMLVHVNTTAEEYLQTVQFCLAVPKVLLR